MNGFAEKIACNKDFKNFLIPRVYRPWLAYLIFQFSFILWILSNKMFDITQI